MTAGVVLAGIGSLDRRDDGVGPVVAALAAAQLGTASDVGPVAEPLDLLGRWDDASLAVVVDAVRSSRPAGTVSLVELRPDGAGAAGPAGTGLSSGATSTHGLGLARVLRLAVAVGSAPARVVVVGIDGEDFGRGTGFSPSVAAAVPEALRRVVSLVASSSCA